MKNKNIIIYILLTIGCVVTIFWLSSQERAVSSVNSLKILTSVMEFLGKVFNFSVTKQQIRSMHNLFRKAAHFSVYAVLAVFSYKTFRLIVGEKKRGFGITLIFCVLMAIFDELHQLFVPGRSAEVRDVIIDTLGACFGLAVVWLSNTGLKIIRKLTNKKK